MTKMRWNFTLPELEAKLDGLAEGALLQISTWDYQPLFGTNDVAAARLRNLQEGMLASPIMRARRSCFARSLHSLTSVFSFRSEKMSGLKIPHDAFVFVGDGRKALFLRNEGDEKFPNLKTERVFEDKNPATHEQGSERPGRVSKALDSGQRSAVEPVDWHHLEEQRFAKRVAAAIEHVVRTRKVPALVVVAPPKTLADLRSAFHVDVQVRIIAEINKDLTKHSVGEIEKHLAGAA